ncbi:hypothetical protein CHCC5021_2550 [Bacillus paralicheniformis]|nr:hypothetical protein CHCC5021_2550 [Bacillus paralicheniformis]TWN71653.1 hypothetical protein CHCC14427_3706 [Bacillus paralicheniformis]
MGLLRLFFVASAKAAFLFVIIILVVFVFILQIFQRISVTVDLRDHWMFDIH